MHSSAYRQFAWAVENRVGIVCRYDGALREICPVILGHNAKGAEAALVWQTGGATSDGPLLKPNWKCLLVSKAQEVELRGGQWQAGSSHRRRQDCVKEVDYDANEASPYSPRRSLGSLRGIPLKSVGKAA